MISLSYSRISLADIAQKLQLDSPEDAEFIVAKVTKTVQCILTIELKNEKQEVGKLSMTGGVSSWDHL